uniref:uncharacterized protein LOC120343067 n=1 Tax=Styela clava TaxID=7725 RepID=UPI00193A5F8B|nr:uncharacterized protein LOC120343067 [Styela clava]
MNTIILIALQITLFDYSFVAVGANHPVQDPQTTIELVDSTTEGTKSPCDYLENIGKEKSTKSLSTRIIQKAAETPCTEEILETDLLDSWSAVQKVKIHCPQRYPQTMIEHRCASKYCIDPISKEINYNLLSQEIKTNLAVCMKNSEGKGFLTTQSISLGCTCIFINTSE